MKKSKLTGIIAFVLCLVFLLGACAKPTQQTAVTAPSDEAAAQVVESTTVKSVEASEISLYEVKDGDYTIKISPIYQKDGKTVAAAYILSVKDKDNKEVKAADFPALLSVVQATSTKNAITLTKDKNKQYIVIKSYADDKGNLLILQDAADVNKNGKTDEFLQLTKVTNDKGSTHYLLTDTVIKLVTEKNTVYAIIGGKKIKVDVVNSKNTKVKAKIESESKEKKKTASTTKKASTTTKKAETSTEKTDTYGRIVLLKDGMAKSDLDGVTLAQNEVLIHKGGDYLITSDTSVWHGVIKIQLKNTEEADVRFENVDIAYNKSNIIQILDSSDSSKRDFIETEANEESIDYDDLNDAMDELSDVKSAPNVSLTFPTGTASSFECSSNIKTGVIYNESKLEIKGNGKVSISATANANNVICSAKSVTFKNVSAHLQSAAYGVTDNIGGSKGVFSYGKVNIESGNVTIHSNGDAVRCTRFYQYGGTFTANSSAADGIDAESSININGGKSTVTALNKSSFKVRRVNIQERWDDGERVNKNDAVRDGKGDGFYIAGGTVKGESKKVSDYKMHAAQTSFVCRTVKVTRGSAAEVKAPVKWNVSSVASSSNPCVKFLYSSPSVSAKNYDVKVNGTSKDYRWEWSGKYGACYVTYSNAK